MKFKDIRMGVVVAGLSVVMMVAAAEAAMVAPTDVMINDGAVTTSLTGKMGDVTDGAKVFKGRKLGNCLACHVNSAMANQPFQGEVGPSLDGVAGRYSEAQLRAIIVNSKAVFGDHTIMPSFYRIFTDPAQRVAKKFQGKSVLSAQQVEDIVAYLKTLK